MSEIKFYSEPVEMDYTRSPGKLLGKFFASLRDEGIIKGIRCSHCSSVFVPPQQYCPLCTSKMSNLIPMPQEATIASFTIVKKDAPFTEWKAPFTYVAVKYDATHSTFWHRLKETENVNIGDKIQAVFKPESEREGSLLDILYFEKIPEHT